MEAVLTRPVEARQDELPPPPAPFPTELLRTDQGSELAEQSQPVSRTEGAYRGVDSPAPRDHMTQTTVDLTVIQQSCVRALSSLIPDSPEMSSAPLPPLSFADSQLAQALTELLEVSYELETLRSDEVDGSSSCHPPDISRTSGTNGTHENGSNGPSGLDMLTTRLLELRQSASQQTDDQVSNGNHQETTLHPSIGFVRETLAWARVDALSLAILDLVSTRQDDEASVARSRRAGGSLELDLEGHDDSLPSYNQHEGAAPPPDYQAGLSSSSQKVSSKKAGEAELSEQSYAPISQEKMHRELDGLTTAIERFQHASSRLLDQRSEPSSKRTSKAEVEARIERNRMNELEQIWKLIERTHGRRRDVDNTRVDGEELAARREARRKRYLEGLLEQGEETRLSDQDAESGVVNPDLARARDMRNRDRFLQELVDRANDGRLEDQDAQPPIEGTHSERKQHKQQALLADIIAQTDASRYKTQDYPQSLETRMEGKRQAFMDNLVDYSSSGRMRDQDSKPPTPKQRNMTLEDPTGLVTIQAFFTESNGPSTEADDDPSTGKMTGMASKSEEEKKKGTFQKIAGLVRRSGLGLSIKSPTEDLSSWSYVAEHQENLLAVQIMLSGASLSLKDDLIIETEKNVQPGCGVSEAVIISKRDASVSMCIPLPTPVAIGQTVPFKQSDLHVEAKLSALATAPNGAISSLNTILQHPLSAPELRKIQPKALCCTACDREVADLSRTLRSEEKCEGSGFKDLPSEHWAEMLEVWMCHDDPAFTAQLAQRTNEGFWPSKDTVLVGGSYLLVHQDECKSANLQFDPDNNAGWAVFKCVCGEVLGKKRSAEEKFGAGTLRFSKWSIAMLRGEDDSESVEPVRFRLSVFIMSDLLELAQAHATYRFVISDEDASAARLLIWVFNPSVRISYRKAGGHAVSSPLPTSTPQGRRGSILSRRSSSASVTGKGLVRTLQAAKILFKVLDNGLPSTIVPGFGTTSGGQVENLSYPTEVCEGLVAALRESNSVYPPGARRMIGLEVGFLERL